MKKCSLLRSVCIISVVWAATTNSAPAQSYSSFSFYATNPYGQINGSQPWAGLLQGVNGNFYGTTFLGGDTYGSIFEITSEGEIPKFYVTQNMNTGLVQVEDGELYGTEDGGYEEFFKIGDELGNWGTLYSFCPATQQSCGPPGPPNGPNAIIRATDGNFYGMSDDGGVYGDGTVFKITPDGDMTTLHNFDGADGGGPYLQGLVEATDGNFYGTVNGGGANTNSDYCPNGCGTVFEITPEGMFTTLYNFCAQTNCIDGAAPLAGLIQATDGNFYGTTTGGGVNGAGTVFTITATGSFTTLYNFCTQTNCTDGGAPWAPLVQGTDGNFYGTTAGGGNSSDCPGFVNGTACGTVFEITPAGTLTTLHSFTGYPTDGSFPTGGLIQATDGSFYGTTQNGGPYRGGPFGTVFKLSIGFGPFVQPRLTMGKVGAKIAILGNNLAGTSSVTFNGTAATYTVFSSTEIRTTVPAGATTGPLTVTTPSGMLNSNGPFYVTPQLKSFTPKKGPVGTVVKITGVSLTQTTGVNFNGVAATGIAVISDTEVSATVPTEATTGSITITTAGGSLASKDSFTVTE